MNRAANTYWIDDRLRAQRVSERAIPSFVPTRDLSRDLIGTRAEIRKRGGIIPSWVIFGMIILGTFVLCVTVTMRTHAERRSAIEQHAQMAAEVETLRTNNAALDAEVRKLRTDTRAIEAEARTRLNMVRANEIVVPAE